MCIRDRYVYSVAEDQVEGYLPPSVNGFVITNVLAQETITIPGVKVWVAPLGLSLIHICIKRQER